VTDLDAVCARCGATDVPLALSSKSGFKRKVCASVSACRQRRKMARLVAEVAALRQQLDEARDGERIALNTIAELGREWHAAESLRLAAKNDTIAILDAEREAAEADRDRLLVVYRAAEAWRDHLSERPSSGWWGDLAVAVDAYRSAAPAEPAPGDVGGVPVDTWTSGDEVLSVALDNTEARFVPTDLIIVEDRTYEKADARWVRLRCATDPDCVLIEVRFEPSENADAFVAFLRAGHEQLHAPAVDSYRSVAPAEPGADGER
jgi:hypothetical protein